MLKFEDAIRICEAATPRTPLDRLAGDMLGRAHGLQARVRPVIEAARLEPAHAAIQRLRISARNLNRWVTSLDGPGAGDAAAAIERDGTNAMEIAMVADALAACADQMERAR